MSPNLHKILKAFAKELTIQVTKDVTERLRESYVDDVTAIVKECLNKNSLSSDSGGGWITRKGAAKKYGMSVKAVGDKLKLFKEGAFKIERKWMARHNMLNEAQFVIAFDQKGNKIKPSFLQNSQKAA